ncbi:phosphoglycerate dehydrogenase-like enzyme [Thermocatellispora tengchongensis]|uniref:Phosphoglycerate dehydrogenase-like enzyme n=1 Tax=Thermocatellispora tengchongensis TaxID=1073253 RepID=A0A840PML9_9ACTN|nr:hydroxyacid dehydrogenase [Thermocatellispora tengchongensis]MBB5138920.1 phosphoglycerate dehydrogenase-like enzyme [Thermocatellispora tengchongensis]
MIQRPEALVVMARETYRMSFDDERRERLVRLAVVREPVFVTELDSPAARERLATADVLVTGWGCPPLTAEVLAGAPRLRAVFHAAGTVKDHVTGACWERGIVVTSAARANAIPVSEYTLAAVLMAGKRAHRFAAAYRGSPGVWEPWRDAVPDPSNYRRTVGIVGLSNVGRRVAALLRSFDVTVLAADPHASAAGAAAVGASLVDLETLLRRSDIVTLHAPQLPETRHLLDRRRLAMLRDGATVINTARGGLVDTAALTDECAAGRLDAILDVTDPEPLPAGSPLYTLPNVVLTPHIAGALGSETYRLVDAALDELARFAEGRAPLHAVRGDDLSKIA